MSDATTGELMDAVIQGLNRENGSFGLSLTQSGDWVVAIEFGQEAPDSPMAGGAAYGMADTAEEALRQAVDQTGWLRRG